MSSFPSAAISRASDPTPEPIRRRAFSSEAGRRSIRGPKNNGTAVVGDLTYVSSAVLREDFAFSSLKLVALWDARGFRREHGVKFHQLSVAAARRSG